MNGPQVDQNIQQEVTRVKKDMNTLREDGINKASQVSEDLHHSSEDVTALVNSGLAQLGSEFEKVKGDATKTVADATTTVKKNVGNGLSQFNAKAEEVAKKLPGGVGEKAGLYPWVAMSFALLAGFLLRGFLMPGRNYRE